MYRGQHFTACAPVKGLGRREEGVRQTGPRQVESGEEDVAAALAMLNPIVAAAVNTQLLTGARPGELLGLRIRDLERRDRVEVDGVPIQTEGLWVAVLAEHKTAHAGGGPRVILFGPLPVVLESDYRGKVRGRICLFSDAGTRGTLPAHASQPPDQGSTEPGQPGRSTSRPRPPGEPLHG